MSIKDLINRHFWVIQLFVTLLLFWPIYSSQTLADIDYQILIGVIENLNSFSQYYNSLEVLDVQPVRDLFIILVSKLSSVVDFRLFGAFNVLCWFLISIIVKKILDSFNYTTSSGLISLVILVHPISIWVVSWPSAIKHLLAILFVTISSYFAFDYERNKIKKNRLLILLFYILAVLSHPIIILWPFLFLAFYWENRKEKNHLIFCSLLFFTMFIFLGINYIYYANLYPLQLGVQKISQFETSNFAANILGISRSFTQILVPVSFAQFYNLSNKLNLIGLPLIIIISLICYFKFSRKFFITSITSVFFTLVVIYSRETNIFVSDTYLLAPLICLTVILSFLLNKKVFFFIFLALFLKSSYEIKYTVSDTERFRVSYERETNCRNSLAYTNHLLHITNFEEFQKIGKLSLSNHCILLGASARTILYQAYAMLFYLEEKMSVDEKIKRIETIEVKSPAVFLILSKLYMQKNDSKMSQFLEEIYKRAPKDGKNKILLRNLEMKL